jgi:uncharacterized membrane protein
VSFFRDEIEKTYPVMQKKVIFAVAFSLPKEVVKSVLFVEKE